MASIVRTSLSSFPERLPEGRIIEQFLLDHTREVFELHGSSGIETRAVGTLEQFEAKEEISKEVYILDRLRTVKGAETGCRSSKERRMGLHFDLTIPFTHYAVKNADKLDSPLEYYQIQGMWRGERPQEGHPREFTQADVNVIGKDSLPFHFEVGLPLVMIQALAGLPIPKVTAPVNNRKVVQGMRESFGVDNVEAALRSLDKIDEIGFEGVARELAESGISGRQAEMLLAMVQIRSADPVVI